MGTCLPLEEEPGEAPGGGGGHVPLVGDGHPEALDDAGGTGDARP